MRKLKNISYSLKPWTKHNRATFPYAADIFYLNEPFVSLESSRLGSLFRVSFIGHLQRVRLASRGRSLLRTPGPVPYGTCICSNVETIHSWTCHVYGPFEFRISLGTSILLPGRTESLISVSVMYIQARGNSSDYYLYTKYWIKVVGRGNERQLWNVLSPFIIHS